MTEARIEVVCPFCRNRLHEDTREQIACEGCRRVFPVRSGVPVLLSDEESASSLRDIDQRRWIWERYISARRQSPLNLMYYDWWVERMFAALDRGYDGPLLELMAGGAEISRRAPSFIRSAVALDLNLFLLETAAPELAAAGRLVTPMCATAQRLPFRDASVPLIMIQGGLHHVRSMLAETLQEIARVLAPGGELVASEPANDHWLIRRIRRWQYARSAQQGDDPEEDGFTREEIASALAAAGLRLRTYQVFGYVAYPLMGNTDLLPLLARSRRAWLGRALVRLDTAVESVPVLRRMGFASIFTATRYTP